MTAPSILRETVAPPVVARVKGIKASNQEASMLIFPGFGRLRLFRKISFSLPCSLRITSENFVFVLSSYEWLALADHVHQHIPEQFVRTALV